MSKTDRLLKRILAKKNAKFRSDPGFINVDGELEVKEYTGQEKFRQDELLNISDEIKNTIGGMNSEIDNYEKQINNNTASLLNDNKKDDVLLATNNLLQAIEYLRTQARENKINKLHNLSPIIFNNFCWFIKQIKNLSNIYKIDYEKHTIDLIDLILLKDETLQDDELMIKNQEKILNIEKKKKAENLLSSL